MNSKVISEYLKWNENHILPYLVGILIDVENKRKKENDDTKTKIPSNIQSTSSILLLLLLLLQRNTK